MSVCFSVHMYLCVSWLPGIYLHLQSPEHWLDCVILGIKTYVYLLHKQSSMYYYDSRYTYAM